MASILFDFENLALRCFYGNKDVQPESESPNYDFWEYLVFNSIYRMLYKEKIHEVILALDRESWRKLVYPPYKANRKKKKEESKVNWDLFNLKKNEFLEKLQNNIPFKILAVNRAEADDIIGTLVNFEKLKDPIIVSMDCDYLQLSNKCRIYHPLQKNFVTERNPDFFLLSASILGQKKDNIFNVKTPWDWPETKKKPAFGEKGLEKLINEGKLDNFLDTPIEYKFMYEIDGEEKEYNNTILPREFAEINRKVMDLKFTPKVMSDKTIEIYDNYTFASSPDGLYNFFKEMKWNEVLDNYTQVESKLLELY